MTSSGIDSTHAYGSGRECLLAFCAPILNCLQENALSIVLRNHPIRTIGLEFDDEGSAPVNLREHTPCENRDIVTGSRQ